MTTSLASPDLWPDLSGRRQAQHESIFEGDDTRGEGALLLAGRIGEPPMPWQQDNVRAILRMVPLPTTGVAPAKRRWTHPVYCLICVRQAGKSEILLLRCLYGLFKLGETIIYSTHQWKTAKKLAKRLEQMIKARPSLRRRLKKPATFSGGNAEIYTVDDQGNDLGAILFTTRSNDVARGWDKVELLIVDEAYNATDGEMAALLWTTTAADNPQIIYASSAVNVAQHANGQVLAGIRRNGHAKKPRLGFREYMAPEPPEGMSEGDRRRMREDPAVQRLANPSHGVIQTDEKLQAALLAITTPEGWRSFEVEVLGWGDWPAPADLVASEIPREKWNAMRAGEPPKLTGSPALGLHLTGGVWSISAAWYTDAGRAHVEVGYAESVTSADVTRAVVDLVAAWDPVAIAIKGRSDAAAIESELIKAGIEPVMVGGAWPQYCGGFLNAARSDALAPTLSHSGQPQLDDAASVAVRKDMPAGGFIWDEDAAGVSGGALFSATLAHGALLAHGQPKRRKPAKPAGRTDQARTRANETNVLQMAF